MEGTTLLLVVGSESDVSLLDKLQKVCEGLQQKGLTRIPMFILSGIREMFNVVIRHRGKFFSSEDVVTDDGEWDWMLRANTVTGSKRRKDMRPINAECIPLEVLEGLRSSVNVVTNALVLGRCVWRWHTVCWALGIR